MSLTKHFDVSEFACRRLAIPVPPEYLANVTRLAEQLEVLRRFVDKPIHVLSGYRPPEYNATLKGAAKNSQHLTASAADIAVETMSPRDVHAAIESLILRGRMTEGGLGLYATWNHFDVRGRKARWSG